MCICGDDACANECNLADEAVERQRRKKRLCQGCADLTTRLATARRDRQDDIDIAYMEGGAHAKVLYEERTEAAESRVAELEGAIKTVEWIQFSSTKNYGKFDYVCIWHCGGTRETGHKKGCRRQQALGLEAAPIQTEGQTPPQ